MPAEQAAANPLIPMIVIGLIMYFLVFKPQKDEQKKQKEMRGNLKKNDQVVTAGGIHGTVVIVKDATVVLRLDDKVRVEFSKESISTQIGVPTVEKTPIQKS